LILSNTSSYLGPASYFDEQIRRVLDAPDMGDTAQMFMRNWFPASMLAGANEIVDRFRAMVLGTTPRGLAGCFAAVRDTDLRRTVALITAPTLVIGGEDDKVTLASHSEALAAAIPGAELLLLPGVHMLNVERQGECVRRVMDFLRGFPRRKG
jgi:3-oxoadipate enol-lactonase